MSEHFKVWFRINLTCICLYSVIKSRIIPSSLLKKSLKSDLDHMVDYSILNFIQAELVQQTEEKSDSTVTTQDSQQPADPGGENDKNSNSEENHCNINSGKITVHIKKKSKKSMKVIAIYTQIKSL